MIVGHIGGAGSPYEIQKSLRFRASAQAYLSRTPVSAGNRRTWTWSGWVKRGQLGASFYDIFAARTGNESTFLRFNGDTFVFLQQNASAALDANYLTTAVYRDPSAWFHVLLSVDTTQATAANRVFLYINGASVPLTASTTIAQNNDTHINRTVAHAFGVQPTQSTGYFDGYLSEINFIDGQRLDPSYFGQVSAETGAWIPKKYTGTYGTNGFYLPFNDGSTLANLAADRSGNGNNWTANNISLTPGVTYDWMDDTPMNNFAVLNAVHAGRSTLTNGNLTASGAADLPTIIPDSGTWYFERGGSAQIWTPPTAFPSGTGDYNFGQRPWQSTGPTGGQKALCTKNLPTPSILNPKKHFDVVLATGANIKSTAEAVFPGNFLEWIKDRGNTNNHQLIDSVRGTSAVLQSNTTAAETTYSAPSGSSVGWTWKAGGAPVTNNAGSIQSQVSANPQAGFSIVTYQSNSGTVSTVGHGLGVAPAMIIFKNRTTAATDWVTYHRNIGNTAAVFLNLTNVANTSATYFNNTTPTSSVFTISSSNNLNNSTNQIVAYCFAEIPGYSKIGSYTGNGSADGPFVYCGFRPRYVLIKRVNAAGNWCVVDTSRSTYNANGLDLCPNLSSAELFIAFDFLSNGIKPRVFDLDYNASGDSYIFYAIAEQPFQYANAR